LGVPSMKRVESLKFGEPGLYGKLMAPLFTPIAG
jgi:hypothetical protein